jgi:hypothetical protein
LRSGQFSTYCDGLWSLHYAVIMNSWLGVLLVLGSWVMSILHSTLQILMVVWLSFCTNMKSPLFLWT